MITILLDEEEQNRGSKILVHYINCFNNYLSITKIFPNKNKVLNN